MMTLDMETIQIPLSNRLKSVSESQTIMMARLARDLMNQGKDVINLSLGEPDFQTPQHIKDAAKKAIDDGYSYYPPIAGYADFRAVIAQKFKRENNLDYTPEQIIVSTGAKQSIANAILSLVGPGDEVIVAQPYWVSYLEIIKIAEGTSVVVNAGVEHEFKIQAADLEKAITPKTKVFIYSSPCNPTGAVYSREELEAIADVLRRHPQVAIISDEIYEHINFVGKHTSIAELEGMKDRTVIINGVSKAFAMTGWRIGYMAAPLYIAKACDKIQGQFTSAASSIAQRAALAALDSSLEPTLKMKAEFLKRRDLCLKLIRQIPHINCPTPDGAFYLFPDVSAYFGKSFNGKTINNSEELCFYLLENALVSLVTGSAFGAPNCIRISYATSEDKLTQAFQRVTEALKLLQ